VPDSALTFLREVFDGEGRFVTAVLRPAKRPGGKEIRTFLRRLLRAIRTNWPNTQILRRADSHYCCPEVLDWCWPPKAKGANGERCLRDSKKIAQEAYRELDWAGTDFYLRMMSSEECYNLRVQRSADAPAVPYARAHS
jgi:Transposase DDE domain group 1